MKMKTKKRLTHRDVEADADAARLRSQIGRLVSKKITPGGETYDYRPQMTFRMFCIVSVIDRAMIGTPDYMGMAFWWNHEYKFYLREATNKQRKRAHDAILAGGLPLNGVSDEHAKIVAWATNNGKVAAEKMGCLWSPYAGPRPAKRGGQKR
jgi:hypothetical protein